MSLANSMEQDEDPNAMHDNSHLGNLCKDAGEKHLIEESSFSASTSLSNGAMTIQWRHAKKASQELLAEGWEIRNASSISLGW